MKIIYLNSCLYYQYMNDFNYIFIDDVKSIKKENILMLNVFV